jgi:thiamine biosynthesis lipoprotein
MIERVMIETAADLRALGTTARLVVTEPRARAAAIEMLESVIAETDAACSRFRFDSELVALDAAEGRTVHLSPLLTEALAVALRAARLTGGDVDPTIGATLAALGYDRDFAQVAPDGPAVTAQVVPLAGWRQVALDIDARTVTMPAGTRLDLGATAKAWAADRAAARIAAALGCGALVSLGGDTAVAGPAPRGGWTVRVQDVTGHPAAPPAGPYETVTVREGGLATSGTSARRWRRGGSVLHHIIDPHRGVPAAPVWRTVSVAAGSCVDANTASTAAVIRGLTAPAWLTRLGLPARLVAVDGGVHRVGGWPEPGSSAA